MAIIRWKNQNTLDPVQEFDRLQEEINDLFNFDRSGRANGLFDRKISPAIDVVEMEDAFAVYCDLPGVEKNDIELSIADRVLTIKGTKHEAKQGDAAKVYRRESWEGQFQRTLSVPDTVDVEHVDAGMKDGVLKVTLPKKPESKPRTIAVNVQ